LELRVGHGGDELLPLKRILEAAVRQHHRCGLDAVNSTLKASARSTGIA